MRARQRHLNAKAAGASLVLDARYIPAQTDYSYLTSWPDRSGNAYDFTNSNTGSAPFYRTNTMNGLPSALYDGSNDYLQNSAGLDPMGFISVVRTSSSSGTRAPIGSHASNGLPDGAYYINCSGSSRSVGLTRVSSTRTYLSAGTTGDLTQNALAIFSGSRSDSAIKGAINGVFGTEGTNSITPSTVVGPSYVGCGAYNTANRVDFFIGDIAIMIVLQGSRPSDSIMKRLHHFAGYSYKIACS
jgi:hypothetical protein